MRQLAQALMEPAEVAVVKCKGHSKENSLEGKGNDAADQAAKKAAGYKPSYNMLQAAKTVYDVLPSYDKEMLSHDQDEASPHEKTVWKERGAVKVEGIWRGPDGRLVLPPGLMCHPGRGPWPNALWETTNDEVFDIWVASFFAGHDRELRQRMFNMYPL